MCQTLHTRSTSSQSSQATDEHIVLFGRPSSSNTQKVLWVLEEADVPYNLTLASARLGPDSQLLTSHSGGQAYGIVDTPEYRRQNPHGRIPTICDPRAGGIAIWESHTIARYLVRSYMPSWLGGPSAAEQARSEMWMDWVLGPGDHQGTSFPDANHHLIDQTARTPAGSRDLACIEKGHQAYLDVLAKAEAQLGDSNGYLAGTSEPTLADVPLAVELNRWSLCWHALRRDGVELSVPHMPALARYYVVLMKRPAFRRAVYESELRHQRLDVASDSMPELQLAGHVS